ncbi:MAG: BT4734/BF3469 family protein [Candidatus Heimdallarchaeaceae archaeon]
MTQTITIFKSIHDTSAPFHRSLEQILTRIKNGKSKDLVKMIRDATTKDQQGTLKKQLPAICFSGTFYKRNDHAINEHSGLICLDFDGYSSTKEMMKDKKKFPQTFKITRTTLIVYKLISIQTTLMSLLKIFLGYVTNLMILRFMLI